jgi:hypothetical protein
MALSSISLTDATITLEVHLPQLDVLATQLIQAIDRLGERMADVLDPITQSINNLTTMLDAEATEIAEELRRLADANPTPEAINAVATRIDGLAERVRTLVTPPEAPPV